MLRKTVKKDDKCWIEIVVGVGLQFMTASGQLRNI